MDKRNIRKSCRTSRVWKVSHEELQEIIDKSFTISEIIQTIGLDGKNGSGNYRTLYKRFEEEEFDFIKFEENKKQHEKNRIKNLTGTERKTTDEILIKGSTYNRNHLKKRLIKEELLEYKCDNCGIHEWDGKPISLQLDHINGVNDDNRIENLRLLCPNCHSQTDTYSGKHNKKQYYCIDCNGICGKTSKRCIKCHNIYQNAKRRKVKNRPSLEQLEQDVNELGYRGTGRKYHVSDSTIKKWIKYYKNTNT